MTEMISSHLMDPDERTKFGEVRDGLWMLSGSDVVKGIGICMVGLD